MTSVQTTETDRFPNPSGVVSARLVDRAWTACRRYRPSARNRHDSNQGAGRPSAFLQVELDAPLTGPVALGHLSHFGLGLFIPVSR